MATETKILQSSISQWWIQPRIFRGVHASEVAWSATEWALAGVRGHSPLENFRKIGVSRLQERPSEHKILQERGLKTYCSYISGRRLKKKKNWGKLSNKYGKLEILAKKLLGFETNLHPPCTPLAGLWGVHTHTHPRWIHHCYIPVNHLSKYF